MANGTKTKDPVREALKKLARQREAVKATQSDLAVLGYVPVRGRGSNPHSLQDMILKVLEASKDEVTKTSDIATAVLEEKYVTSSTAKNFGIQVSNALTGLRVARCVSNKDRGYWSITKTGSSKAAG